MLLGANDEEISSIEKMLRRDRSVADTKHLADLESTR